MTKHGGGFHEHFKIKFVVSLLSIINSNFIKVFAQENINTVTPLLFIAAQKTWP